MENRQTFGSGSDEEFLESAQSLNISEASVNQPRSRRREMN